MARVFLNSKQKKKLLKSLTAQFGFESDEDFHLIQDGDNIYYFNSDIDGVDLDSLRLSQIGMRIGVLKDDFVMLTVQGCQLLGDYCSKNILEFDNESMRDYLKGEDLICDENKGIFLLKSNDNYFGCSKCVKGILRNNVERTRQIDCKD